MTVTELRKSIRENPYLTSETRADLLAELRGCRGSYSCCGYEFSAFNRTPGSDRAVRYASAERADDRGVTDRLGALHAEYVVRDFQNGRGEAADFEDINDVADNADYISVQPV